MITPFIISKTKSLLFISNKDNTYAEIEFTEYRKCVFKTNDIKIISNDVLEQYLNQYSTEIISEHNSLIFGYIEINIDDIELDLNNIIINLTRYIPLNDHAEDKSFNKYKLNDLIPNIDYKGTIKDLNFETIERELKISEILC